MFDKKFNLQKRATLSLFGVDIKITPDNEVKIIEINGARSGMNGFGQCYDPERNMEAVASLGKIDWFDYRNYFPGNVARRADVYWMNYLGFLKDSLKNKPLFTFHGGLSSALENYVSKIERFHSLDVDSDITGDNLVCSEPTVNCSDFGLEFLKEEPLGKEETEFLMRFKDAEAIIWNKSDPGYWRFDEKRHLVINSHTIESTIEDKCTFYKKMMPVAKEVLPRTIDFSLMKGHFFETDLTKLKNTNFLEDLVNWNCGAYILKPANGSCGKEVYFLPREIIIQNKKLNLKLLKTLDEKGIYRLYSYSDTHKQGKSWIMGFLLQEFIDSKPIYSRKTSAYHDGCMRMIVVMQSENGKIKSMNLGGYWRLAPSPLNSGNSQTSHIANLCNHAIPEMASDEDVGLAWEKIKAPMKNMYEEMLKIPILKSDPGASRKISGKI